MSGEPQPAGLQGWGLAPELAPALREACGGRLSAIRWFRADWQRGGASTGYASFEFDDGPRDVVVKIPIGPRELRATRALAEVDAPTPRLPASGDELGGYDIAWAVMERLPGEPIAAHLNKGAANDLAVAAASFYKHAQRMGPPPAPVDSTDWAGLLETARSSVRDNELPDRGRWNGCIRKVQKGLGSLLERWGSRSTDCWCHGDLHPGNAMRRPEGSPWGPPGCVLLDLAEVHPGHWVEDAVYLERLHWARPDALDGVKPVSRIARERKSLGLDTSDDYNDLANIRRILLAACVPAFLDREGHPKYLSAALGVLERLTPQTM